MADLIDRQALINAYCEGCPYLKSCLCGGNMCEAVEPMKEAPAVDAVEVATLEIWLYKIAMNNIGAPVADMAEACEIIISRLGGLRKFAEERREENE